MRKKLFTCLIALAAMLTFSLRVWADKGFPKTITRETPLTFFAYSKKSSFDNFSKNGAIRLEYVGDWSGIDKPIFEFRTLDINGDVVNDWLEGTAGNQYFYWGSTNDKFGIGSTSDVNQNYGVQVRLANNSTWNVTTNHYVVIKVGTQTTATDGASIQVCGNIMSLLSQNDFARLEEIPADYCFYKFFQNINYSTCWANIYCDKLLLPATTLRAHCYEDMFSTMKDCLCTGPQIFALYPKGKCGEAVSCCKNMFSSCSEMLSLTTYFLDWGEATGTNAPTYNWLNSCTKCTKVNCPTSLTKTKDASHIGTKYSSTTSQTITPNYFVFHTNGGTWDGECSEDCYRQCANPIISNPLNSNSSLVFAGWYDDSDAGEEVDLETSPDEIVHCYAHYEEIPQECTITIVSNNSEYGSVNESELTVEQGTAISVEGAELTIGENNTITATPTTSDAQYTYAFSGWNIPNSATTVTGDITITANFTRTTNQYAVTINTPENGTLTVKNGETPIASGTKVDYGTTLTVTYEADAHYHFVSWTNDGAASVTVDAAKTIGATFAPNVNTLTWAGIEGATLSGDYTAAGDVAYGTTLVAPTVEKAGFNFLGWDPAFVESTTMPDNDVTYTAQWEESATFMLEDDKYASDSYYTTLETLEGSTKTVTYNRTFPEGTTAAPTWNVFSLPFDYPIENDNNFLGRVVQLDHATYYEGTLTLYFVYQNTLLNANYPYVFYNTGDALENPVFNGVEIVKSEVKTDYAVSCSPQGQVYFKNTIVRGPLPSSQEHDIAFIYNNELGYSKGNNSMRAFRGYFEMEGVRPSGSPAPRRIVMMVDEATALVCDMDVETNTTKKVIEDGILYIERNGVRYNAQGAIIK